MKAAIYNPYWDTLGGGERYTASLIRLLLDENCQVDVWWKTNISTEINDRFSIDISKCSFTVNQPSENYDLLFWVSDGSLPFSLAKKTIIHFQFPFNKVSGHTPINWIKSRFYNFVVNSQFTKSFIDPEYSIRSEIIYPPITTSLFTPLQKSKTILYVGRFSNLTQVKGQDTLIQTFKKIYKTIPGWQLILAGGTTMGTDSTDFNSLKRSVRGLPIRIITDPKFSEIQNLYGQASIFWSASGYGIDETTSPLKVEHFGMTAVESMAAGCVPLLVNKGGHREIIFHGLNGFLWDSPSQLGDLTVKLIKDDLLKNISVSAVTRSKIFDIASFNNSFKKLINV